MTSTMAEQLQALTDRAAISDLLFSFARALDTKDYQTYHDNFADGGYVELPDPVAPGAVLVLHKERMLELVPKSIGRYTATHHLSTNHQITIDGDQARSHSYLQAVHVSDRPENHWTAGGWYDCEYIRSAASWKFTRVRLTAIWLKGEPKNIRPEP